MATRNLYFAENEFYHVYNRGNDKRIVYKDQADYRRFIELLYLANSEKPINVRDVRKTHSSVFDFDRGSGLVSVGVYCLMPNHFHLLVTPLVEGGLATFMKKLSTSYSMYFNKRYERTGSLFEGNFKAKHADTDEYLKYLFAYIHLNPVKLYQSDWRESGVRDKDKAYEYVANFQYSSLADYVGVDCEEGRVLDKEAFPEYFRNKDEIKRELFDWLSYQEDTETYP